jgi:2-hydroxychromene-2-carboxylate isomerase
MGELPVAPEWEPVLARSVASEDPPFDRDAVARRVAELELQPLRWPPAWPPDARFAALSATYAKRVGRAVAFSLAAFRQVFAGGRDLGDENTVLIAAAACEMHPTALLKGVGLRSVGTALEQANQRARSAGVTSLPAIEVQGRLFLGEDGLDEAVMALGGPR